MDLELYERPLRESPGQQLDEDPIFIHVQYALRR